MFCMGLVFGYLVAGIEASQVSVPTSTAPSVHEVGQTQNKEPAVVQEVPAEPASKALYRTVTLAQDGMRFAYRTSPDGYDITRTSALPSDPQFVDGYQIVRTADTVGQKGAVSEGPQSIQLLVLKNPDKLAARVWALQNTMYSNSGSLRGDMHDETVGRESSVAYVADGLYTMEYHIVTAGKYVYVLIGSYDGDASPLREDFHTFLSTFEFIPTE